MKSYSADYESYGEYLQSDWWKELRQHALWAADYRCQGCGREANETELHVHHLVRNLGEEKPWEVTVFCRDCHAAIEDRLIVGMK